MPGTCITSAGKKKKMYQQVTALYPTQLTMSVTTFILGVCKSDYTIHHRHLLHCAEGHTKSLYSARANSHLISPLLYDGRSLELKVSWCI